MFQINPIAYFNIQCVFIDKIYNGGIMYAFIINPNARSGLGIQIWRQLEAIIKEKGIPYQAYLTRYPGHASDFAREITSTCPSPVITVLGGDGTINEVINGIPRLSEITLAYIPIGSGNDFARSMQLCSDPEAALSHILNPEKYAYINIGRLTWGNKVRRFAISSGIGFDADVCFHNISSHLKKYLNHLKIGKFSYTAVALKRLLALKPGTMSITLDGKDTHTFQKVYFATAMNQRYEGGGFKFCPEADPGDDLIDIIVIADMPKMKALLLLPTAYKGWHTHFKGVHIYSCRSASIQSVPTLPLHTDGEPITKTSAVTFSLEPEKIRLICS